MIENRLFAFGLRYIEMNLPIIPVCSGDHSHMSSSHRRMCNAPGKRPLLKNWQTAGVPSEDEVREWFLRWPTANIGLVLGKISGLIGLDVDGNFGHEKLLELSGGIPPDTWQFSTPGGGMRYLFSVPPDRECRSKSFRDPDAAQKHSELAVLGEGRYTVLPPSLHYSGGIYTWIKAPDQINQSQHLTGFLPT